MTRNRSDVESLPPLKKCRSIRPWKLTWKGNSWCIKGRCLEFTGCSSCLAPPADSEGIQDHEGTAIIRFTIDNYCRRNESTFSAPIGASFIVSIDILYRTAFGQLDIRLAKTLANKMADKRIVFRVIEHQDNCTGPKWALINERNHHSIHYESKFNYFSFCTESEGRLSWQFSTVLAVLTVLTITTTSTGRRSFWNERKDPMENRKR